MDRITSAIEKASQNRRVVGSGRRFLAGMDADSIQTIPVSKQVLEANHLVSGLLDNPVSEYYRLLRTKILRAMSREGWRVLGVTGPSTASGKSLTAANLAIAIANEPNHSAILIDADLRKPSLSSLFGINAENGLNELMAGTATLEQVVISPGIADLGIIFNKQQRYGSSDALMGRPVHDLIKRVRESDEGLVLIFDLPPVFVGDDAVALANVLDAMLLIVDSGRTTREQLQGTMELLRDGNVLGCVLNKAPDEECQAQQYGYY